jgi:hypothetical protein
MGNFSSFVDMEKWLLTFDSPFVIAMDPQVVPVEG